MLEAKNNPISGISISAHPPALLNTMLFSGDLEVSAISTFEYLLHAEEYVLLPDLCINSHGHVKSVLLFSRVPLSELSAKQVLCTPESATSTNLLRILLHKHDITPSEFRVIEKGDSTLSADALLYIGDAALTFDSSDHPFCYDLAHEWDCLFGSPVVFAVWALRRNSAENFMPQLKALHQQLNSVRLSLPENLQKLENDISAAFPSLKTDWKDYFAHLDFHFKPECCDSVMNYANHLVELGILPRTPPLSFLTF